MSSNLIAGSIAILNVRWEISGSYGAILRQLK